MNVSIIDLCFPIDRQALGLGAMWLKWECEKIGMPVVSPLAADVILVTAQSPGQGNDIAKVKKRFKKPVICGGAGGLSPFALGKFADIVCVGDGRRTLQTLKDDGLDAVALLPESWIDGDTRTVDVSTGFPWDCPPIQAEDGAYRLWCGRGCKKKCFFCQTGWATDYEENPNPTILCKQAAALLADKKRIAYLSNDPMQHSFFADLPKVDHGSYSLDFLRYRGLPQARQIRLGVEGVSERLRKFIGKPISTSDLVKASAWLCANGKSVRWFMLAGLPGETAADWQELKDTLTEWKNICHKGVLAVSFTAWQPEPATPMGILPVKNNHDENYSNFKDWFFSGKGWSNRIKLMFPASHESRLKISSARMGLDIEQIKRGGSWGPNDRVNYPHKESRNIIAANMAKQLVEEK